MKRDQLLTLGLVGGGALLAFLAYRKISTTTAGDVGRGVVDAGAAVVRGIAEAGAAAVAKIGEAAGGMVESISERIEYRDAIEDAASIRMSDTENGYGVDPNVNARDALLMRQARPVTYANETVSDKRAVFGNSGATREQENPLSNPFIWGF